MPDLLLRQRLPLSQEAQSSHQYPEPLPHQLAPLSPLLSGLLQRQLLVVQPDARTSGLSVVAKASQGPRVALLGLARPRIRGIRSASTRDLRALHPSVGRVMDNFLFFIQRPGPVGAYVHLCTVYTREERAVRWRLV